mmetsp:Transcript_699/g.1455  ORF Transcript_699/g.1455 Transcript_699/m.1455 type:complete len:623 (+) Transcript_699:410-2278(+)
MATRTRRRMRHECRMSYKYSSTIPIQMVSIIARRKLAQKFVYSYLSIVICLAFFVVQQVTPLRPSTIRKVNCLPGVIGFEHTDALTSRVAVGQGISGTKFRQNVPPTQNRGLSMVLGGPPMEECNDNDDANVSNNKDGDQRSASRKASDFQTALAIVPPLEDWDRLQRARHYARDPVFREWPPAIRLFHPFDKSPNIAFDIAQLIEDLQLEAFDVTLDTWVIIPNVEATKKVWEDQQFLPDIVDGGTLESYYEKLNQQSEEEIQDLIKSEERKGKIKAMKKNANAMAARPNHQEENGQAPRSTGRTKKSPAQLREEQRKSIDEDFGGPCVLCLEPDDESKEKLMELRGMLLEGLGIESYSSPSSLYAWEFVEDMDMGYRPLIPISKFDTFQSAMDKARRLKGLFGDPLTITVTCLDILSCHSPEDAGGGVGDDNDGEEWDSFHILNTNRFAQQASQVEIKKEAWACNAKIMLVGEEIHQDDTANEEMIDKLLESGEIGGGDISMDFTILEDEEESTTDLEKWLDEDDDFDEGTQVAIGRTHFFTGDQRNYKGMPATSVVDAKDRSLGEAGAVSGLARRRGSTSRKQNVWADGEYGRRSKDFLPWGLRERKEKEKYEWIEDEE